MRLSRIAFLASWRGDEDVNSKNEILEREDLEANDKILLYTTTTLSKVRGFSFELLLHLRKRMLDIYDLMELTGKYSEYIITYLKRLQKYGMVEKQGYFWKITEFGEAFLKHRMYTMTTCNKTKQILNRYETDTKQILNRSISTKPKQISLSLYLKKFNLSDVERVVVEYLVDHYNKTGSKFIYIQDIYELAEKLDVNPAMLQEAITNLKQDRIVWLYRDRVYRRWKLGLYKAFVEILKKLHM